LSVPQIMMCTNVFSTVLTTNSTIRPHISLQCKFKIKFQIKTKWCEMQYDVQGKCGCFKNSTGMSELHFANATRAICLDNSNPNYGPIGVPVNTKVTMLSTEGTHFSDVSSYLHTGTNSPNLPVNSICGHLRPLWPLTYNCLVMYVSTGLYESPYRLHRLPRQE
jgi:hypothetical protein